MADINALMAALQKADAAGDTQSAQQFASMIKQQQGQQDPATANQTQPAETPAQTAFDQGAQEGSQQGPVSTAINQAAKSVLMGQGDKVMGAIRWAAQRLAGVKNPDDYATDRAYMGGKFSGSQAANPLSGTAGGVAGAFMGGGILAKTAKAAESLPVVGKGVAAVNDALTPATRDINGTPMRVGNAILNVGKSAGANAAVGGGLALANGQDPAQAAQTAAVSAVAGPTVGKLAEFSLGKLLPASQRAYQAFSQAVGMKPADLEAAINAHQSLTGDIPSTAAMADLASQGKLQSLAKSNGIVADAAIKAARAGSAPLHEQLATLGNATRPQTEAAINNLRDTMMESNMALVDPSTGNALRDEPINDPNGILNSPHIDIAMRPNAAINARLNQPSPVLDAIQNGTATVGDIDTIRKALRDQQNAFMNPAPGSNNARDPNIAREFGNIANQVEQLGRSQVPDYGKALDQYRGLSKYGQGLAHGASGKSVAAVDPGDTQLQTALQSPMGSAGYEHGNALYNAKQVLNSISPNSITPPGGPGLQDVAHATLSTAGKVGLVSKALRTIPGLHLPDSAQQIIAKQLFDPSMTKQAVANLRRGRVTDNDIARLGTMIGGNAGANIAQYLSGNK
jgi:hypothetical protein